MHAQYTPHTLLLFTCYCVILILFFALDFTQFGELGVDFVDLEPRSSSPPEQASEGTLSSLYISSAANQLSSVDTPAPLTYSQLQQIEEVMYLHVP